jgi:hypothetical protein
MLKTSSISAWRIEQCVQLNRTLWSPENQAPVIGFSPIGGIRGSHSEIVRCTFASLGNSQNTKYIWLISSLLPVGLAFCVASILSSYPFDCRTPPTYSTIITMTSPNESTAEGCSCCTVSGSPHSIGQDDTLTSRYRAAATTPTARRTLALPKLIAAVRTRLEHDIAGALVSSLAIGDQADIITPIDHGLTSEGIITSPTFVPSRSSLSVFCLYLCSKSWFALSFRDLITFGFEGAVSLESD